MKKLILILLLITPFVLKAQTDASLNTEADSLKTNSSHNNNAKYFNRILKNIISAKWNPIGFTTSGTSGPATFSGGILNIPNYVASTLPANAAGYLANNGSGTLSWDNTLPQIIQQYSFTTTSGGGTQTAVTIATTSNANVSFKITMVANEVSGGTLGWGTWTQIAVNYKNVSGTLTLIGSSDIIYNHTNDASSPTLTTTISGSNILIQVSPGAGVVYNCKFVVEKVQI